eukprot:CAMPEP_0197727498 /NCGR_PEP_ID=MMETSP1434-20131217/20729_1 /TAXON_ID=265543 /ORGANISM="Minutocellus polymorphus, Strain CCMP3303" /LENGTH=53 /DNA_ID=CAMNT_0043313707 /DNA_START=136 /DNA_END=294 /DNA_ORIENTATION=-
MDSNLSAWAVPPSSPLSDERADCITSSMARSSSIRRSLTGPLPPGSGRMIPLE